MLDKQQREIAQKIIKQQRGIDYELHPVCQRCIYNHTIVKKLDFEIRCNPLPADWFEIKDREFETEQDEFWYRATLDPDFYAKYCCGIESGLRNAQKEILFCNAYRKVLRLPRQTGKTIAMGVEALHYANTHRNQRVLIIVPYEDQIRNIFEKMDEMIRMSNVLPDHFKKFKGGKYFGSKPFEIVCTTTGSRISGFNVNQSGGTTVRGQTAQKIIIDEVDYTVPEAIAAVFSMMTSNPNIALTVGSTPKGTKEFFYESCHSPKFHEVHYKFREIESYTPEIEEDMRTSLSHEDFRREIEAEFIMQESGVFNPKLIDAAVQDYEYDMPGTVKQGIYTIGVDWNEGVAGVHIVVLKFAEERNKFIPVNVYIVPPSEFTQLEAVNRILEFNEIYKPKKILVDQGFGQTQIQMLKKHGVDNPESHLKESLVILDYGSHVERLDPFTKEKKKVSLKPLIVEVSVRYLEKGLIVLPKSEDLQSKMVGQIRNYKTERVSDSNVPKYSKGNVHTMEAWMNALYGMWLLSGDNYLSEAKKYNEAKPAMQKKDEFMRVGTTPFKKQKVKIAKFGSRKRGARFGSRV